MTTENQENRRKVGPIIMNMVVGGGDPQDPPAQDPPQNDPPAVDLNALNAPPGAVVDPPAPQDPPPTDPPQDPPVQDPPQGTYNPAWDAFKNLLNQNNIQYEVPENVRNGQYEEGQTEESMLLNEVMKYTANRQPDLSGIPQTAKHLIEASQKEGFDEQQWLRDRFNQSNVLNLPAREFMLQHLKNVNGKTDENPNGWDADQIQAQVDNMEKSGILESQAFAQKNEYQRVSEQQQAQRNQAQQLQRQQEFEKFQQEQEKTVRDLIQSNAETKDFYGIPFSEAEKLQYDKDFRNMVKINPETGLHPIHEFLLSDDNLYKIGAMIWKGDKGLRDTVTTMKEDIKDDLLAKTNIIPRSSGGGTPSAPGEIDASALAQPEQMNEQ